MTLLKDKYFLDVTAYNEAGEAITLVKPTVAAPSASGHLTFALRELGFDVVGNR